MYTVLIRCYSQIVTSGFFFIIALIDSLGGPTRVNNFLSSLNIKPIDQKNLKSMERRAGQKIEEVAKRSMELAATETYKLEMENVAHEEMMEATGQMGGIIDNLGAGIMPDASPSLSTRIATVPLKPEVFNSPTEQNADNTLYNFQSAAASSACTPLNQQKVKKTGKRQIKNKTMKKNIAPSFPCRTRTGMSLAGISVDLIV